MGRAAPVPVHSDPKVYDASASSQSPGLRASLPQSRGPGLVASPFSGRDLAGGPGEEVFNRCGMEQVLTTAGSRTAHRSAGAAVQGLWPSSGVCLYPRWSSP